MKATGFNPSLPLNINPGFKMNLSNSTCARYIVGGSFNNFLTWVVDLNIPDGEQANTAGLAQVDSP
jgi:hypothetical protein